jgi:polysaccharide pyruvyl transferase WcaK-like protein
MKIIHIGVYDRNIGDNIAIANLQRSLHYYVPNVEILGFDLQHLWEKRNSIEYYRALYNDWISKGIDAIVVGGGGLIEYGGYETFHSGWKLPFWEESLKFTKIPILFYGVGVNIFRGGIDYSPKAKKALQHTINHSKAFGIRNDGSYNKLKDWIGLDTSKVDIVPDPGLLHLDRFGIERKSTVSALGFQPAINQGQGINRERFLTDGNLDIIKNHFKDTLTYPNTIKDFQFGNPVISSSSFVEKYKMFENLDLFLKKYTHIDHIVAMRGHGQMITIGLNIPGIYLSTQDKVRDFSYQNGFENYNVDITEDNWYEKLKEKCSLLAQKNSNYLNEWYEIRDKFILKCHETDKDWILKNFKQWLV